MTCTAHIFLRYATAHLLTKTNIPSQDMWNSVQVDDR